MKRYEQLYTDTSWQPAEAISRAIAALGSERILLGSDWPLLHTELQLPLNLAGFGVHRVQVAFFTHQVNRIAS